MASEHRPGKKSRTSGRQKSKWASQRCRFQVSAKPGGVLSRHYEEGEKLTYHMTGSNQEWRCD